MPNINIAIISIAGSAGKSTFTRHCLLPQIPNAARISVEDWNSGDGEADLEIAAKAFYSLAAQMNADKSQSFLLDIGASNSKAMLQHFSDLGLTRKKINFWVVPVRVGSKERIDTLRTVASLLKLGINPSTIIVIAQAVSDTATFESDFQSLRADVQDLGILFATQPVLYNEVYNILKNGNRTVFEIIENEPDFDALQIKYEGDKQKLLEIGNQMIISSLSETAVQNLMAVFESTPLSSAVRG